MKPHSLTARLSLMFMLVVGSVLLLAGLAFNLGTHQHFVQLDQKDLRQKNTAVTHLLTSLKATTSVSTLKDELNLLLGDHGDIQARLWHADQLVWSSASLGTSAIPRHTNTSDTAVRLWQWQDSQQQYRGLSSDIMTPGFAESWHLELIKNVTVHEHFFHQFRTGLWLGLGICLLLSGLLGWWMVRLGLRPLRQLTELAEDVSASRLQHSLRENDMPTELRPLAGAFNAMLHRLNDDFDRLSSYSAEIAHELRTPVTALQTRTEVTLSRPRDVTQYSDALYENLEGLEQMRRLIDDMLFLAKADNHLQLFQSKQINLRQLAEQVMDYYDMLAEEQQIQLAVTGEATLSGEAKLLQRAFNNLISNAIRYTPLGGRIEIHLRTQAEGVIVEVENQHQRPLEAEQLNRLFERFYRGAPGTQQRDHSHVGLGLAITRAIVENHQGRIRAESDARSTRFIMMFPH
ncbi:heavy metal sensor histidine kinase [Pokkaliibacter sp. CJK22405]|uniref:heavy metal sensor histidine kinase n=1 Tax=Pokkaliibacter sp. CJK22405 TaxID=3384615 RepID=UPI00398505AD